MYAEMKARESTGRTPINGPWHTFTGKSALAELSIRDNTFLILYCIFNAGMFVYRKVAWKHLLDVYPAGLTGRERLEYMKTKSQEYYVLRDTWQQHVKKTEGQVKCCREHDLALLEHDGRGSTERLLKKMPFAVTTYQRSA